MTEDELQQLLDASLPAADRHDVFVEECGEQDVRLRFSPPAGGTWSGAALLAVVDTSLRAVAGVEAELTHLSLTRLKPAQPGDAIVLARVLKRDRATVHAEAWLFSHAVIDAAMHATATLQAADR